MTQDALPKHTIYERDEYIELLFDEAQDLEDEELVDALNDLIMEEYDTPLASIDWRDDSTCWIWE